MNKRLIFGLMILIATGAWIHPGIATAGILILILLIQRSHKNEDIQQEQEDHSATFLKVIHQIGKPMGTTFVNSAYSFSGSYKLNTISIDLLRNAEQLDEGISRNSAASIELHATAEEIQSLSQSMETAMEQTSTLSKENLSELKEMETAMEDIVENTNQIGTFLETISNISHQTNLLSLNAAIEAAKAGVHGRGFAVVASKIRSLADQTKQTTVHIHKLMQDEQQRTQHGLEKIKTLRDALIASSDSVEETLVQSQMIFHAMREQSHATAEISDVSEELMNIKDNVLTYPEKIQENVDSLFASLSEILSGAIQIRSDFESRPDSTDKLLSLAQMDHSIWMMRLLQVLIGKEVLDRQLLISHDYCRLGKWLNGEGKQRFNSHSQWNAMQRHHRAVHESGNKMMEALEANKNDQVESSLLSLMTNSQETINILQVWQAELKEDEY